jgi:histone H3/H4
MRTLEENEAIIERGLKSFIEVGDALKEIRDNKQYEKQYGTGIGWESYLKTRWDMSKPFANDLIKASETVKILKTFAIANVLPDKESQVRELRKAPEDKQAEVWNEAVQEAQKSGRKQPTAKEVSNIVSMSTGKAISVAKKPEVTEKPSEYNEFELKFAEAWGKLIRKYIKKYTYDELSEKAYNMIAKISLEYPSEIFDDLEKARLKDKS